MNNSKKKDIQGNQDDSDSIKKLIEEIKKEIEEDTPVIDLESQQLNRMYGESIPEGGQD